MLFNIIEDGESNNGFQYVIMKLIDFDCSKVNIRRNPKIKENKYIYETWRYLILEILKNKIESINM